MFQRCGAITPPKTTIQKVVKMTKGTHDLAEIVPAEMNEVGLAKTANEEMPNPIPLIILGERNRL